jgi:Icc-related predicted phosphoesterase
MRTLLAIGSIRGEIEALDRLLGNATDMGVDSVAVIGDLGAAWSKADTYREIFRTLGESALPTYWVPGPTDAPANVHLREAHNMEIVFPSLRGVHATAAQPDGHHLFAGMGGEIDDDPDTLRNEEATLKCPGWEAEYRLKVIREFKERQMVFLFTTPPAHKGLREPGSEIVAELIKTYRPRVVIAGGEEPRELKIGTSLVVCPGRLDRGQYALIDLSGLAVELATPKTTTSSA